ncbi:tyrosine-type recombinase/integrase [Homoserinimonas sp. OAct 916]|uniref:tyrosine-type recombinase/integrase n=1 Tax=Homoserinimonas sp. OAct 916 TaxID=2211450 RepID=UPI000DBE3649|nr:tyrosine-type recombinase/integrase [Homoserinimonas sp. OAct 916]
MSRPIQPLGTYGAISVRRVGSKYAATTRYRDMDGRYTRIQATDSTETKAAYALKAKVAEHTRAGGDGDLNRNSTVADLANYWLVEARVGGRQMPQTLDCYEQNLKAVVLPALGRLRLHEVTVGRVDRFLKVLAPAHPSRARRARIVLSLVFDLAVRHDAAGKNPVRDAAPVPHPRKEIRSLNHSQLQALRASVATWRTGENVYGPRPDGRLADVIEMLLGTSARIGEALAIRKCDVDMSVSPPTVTISGTLVGRKGQGLYRQPHTKHSKQWRIIAVPSYTAQAIRSRLAAQSAAPEDAPLFCTRNGTFVSPHNLRRQLRAVLADAGLPEGIELSDITPHTFRRTVATTINRAASSDLAAELLGHTSREITEAFYIQPTKRVNPVTAEILEQLAPDGGELPLSSIDLDGHIE